MSNEDALTGLANRRRWDTELARACADAARTGATLSVIIVDVDRFKAVNDACGHAGGDAALRAIAALLTTRLRRNDVAARIGGDEFAVLLVGTDAAGASHLAEEVADATRRLRLFGPNGPVLTLSIGVADATGTACDPLVLVARADTHLYRAKATRDAVSVAS
jgi:diguanylate cyclase (GGDEF)-like protein